MHQRFSEKIGWGEAYLLRMLPDDDVVSTLLDFCRGKGFQRALIHSAIGSAKDVILRDLKVGSEIPAEPAKVNEMHFTGPFEVLSLEGNVYPMGRETVAHLHVMLGQEDGSVCGGHLFQARIWSTLELALVEIPDSRAYRKRSEATGLNELLVE